jgi:chromosome segregation ATPase
VTQDQIATYRAALREARTSFDQATKRLREIDSESYHLKKDIGRLRRTITALAAMCSEDPLMDNLGITESCLEVMEDEERTVTTADVVQSLEYRGFDLASQKNVAASVHAILTRLANKGKIVKVKIEGKESESVAWRGPKHDPEYDVFFDPNSV